MKITKEDTIFKIIRFIRNSRTDNNYLDYTYDDDDMYDIYKNTEQKTAEILNDYLIVKYFTLHEHREKEQIEIAQEIAQHENNLTKFNKDDYKIIREEAESFITDLKYKECIELMKENEQLRKTIDLQSKLSNKQERKFKM